MPSLVAHEGPPAWLEYVGQGALPSAAVARSAMLADLCSTCGHVMIPIAEECFQMWLNAHSCNSCAHMTPTDMIRVVLVAHFLRDKQAERWAEQLAVTIHQHRKPGQLWGADLVSPLAELPSAALDSVLRHLISMSQVGCVLRILHPQFVPAAADACLHSRTLQLHDQLQTSSELEHFLLHIPVSPSLTSLAVTRGRDTMHGQRLFVQDNADSALATTLRAQTSLRTVDLSGLQLGAASLGDGVPHLSHSLRSLSIARCDIIRLGPSVLPRVLWPLVSLTHLDISSNALSTVGGVAAAQAISRLTALRMLRASSNGMRVDGATALATALPPLQALTSLDVSNNVIQAAGLAALAGPLARLSGLAALDVSGSVFATSGAQTLSQLLCALPALASLDLAWNAIGDLGVSALRDSLAPRAPACPPPLTRLCLRNNTLSRAAADDLSAVLHALRGTLRSLDLSWNRINWGASALSAALATMHELRTLLLRENSMHNGGYAMLLPAVVNLPNLSHFDVSDNLLTSDPFGLLLEAIATQGHAGAAAHCTHVAHARPSLASRRMAPQAPVVHETFHTIDCSSLAGITLGAPNEELDGEQLAQAAAVVPAEAALVMADAPPYVPPAVLDALEGIFDKVFESINRSEQNSIFAAASRVRMPQLQRLRLCGLADAVQCAVPLVSTCTDALRELSLDSVALQPAAAAAFAMPLRACTALTHLNLAGNASMGALGAAAIAPSVRAVLPHLHRLQLAACGHAGGTIVRACFPAAGAGGPAAAATVLLALRDLNASRTAVDQATAVPLLEHLAQRAPRLRSLDLGDTPLANGPDRRAVQKALAHVTQITMLNLANVSGFAVPDWGCLWPHQPM
eukprot:jgi/Ulvmu1/1899/UM012_0058.1